MIVWAAATALTIAFMMWYAARIKKNPSLSPTFELDNEKRKELLPDTGELAGMTRTHTAVLSLFVAALGIMVFRVIKYEWFIGSSRRSPRCCW